MRPFAYEWIRIRTIRSTWIISIVGLVLTFLVALASVSGSLSDGRRSRPIDSLSAFQFVNGMTDGLGAFLPILGAIIGLLAFGHEYRHGTIRPTLSALPRRIPLALAKYAMPSLWMLLVAVLGVAAAFGGALLRVLGDVPSGVFDGPALRGLTMSVVQILLWTVLGAALCAIMRSQIGAIVTLLVWGFIAEPILRGLLGLNALRSLSWLRDRLPITASQAMTRTWDLAGGFPQPHELGWLEAALTFTGTVAVLAAVGTLVFNRRDA